MNIDINSIAESYNVSDWVIDYSGELDHYCATPTHDSIQPISHECLDLEPKQ